MDLGRRILAAGLLIVVINFLWLTNSANHFKIGMIWLVVDILLWLPELNTLRLKAKL